MAAVPAGSGRRSRRRTGAITSQGVTYDVAFTEAADDDLAAVDSGYRSKYGQYASIVDHLEEPGPRAATLDVTPA